MFTPDDLLEARILMIDDQQENLDLLNDILTAKGYRHLVALTDPREAVARYATWRPHLVLLDITMPHLDGFEVLRQLKSVEQEGLLNVLVLTALQDGETRLRALELGAKDFLTKPFSIPEVAARIHNLLEARILYQQVLNHSATLEETVAKRTAALRSAQFEVVERLARVAERRDPETGAHIIRMSRACALVAAAGGWPEEEVELLRYASALHDVGKVGVPDAILLKPGPLSPEEWVVMRRHTTIGAELLGGGTSRLMLMAESIARSHHEWWDGTGYPEGLAGEKIPMPARISAVCDVFDAMTNDRCYHHALEPEEVFRHILAARGTHFDPVVVNWFEEALPGILAAVKRHA